MMRPLHFACGSPHRSLPRPTSRGGIHLGPVLTRRPIFLPGPAVARLAAMRLGNAAAFLLIAVLAGAVLWRGRFPFRVRVVLVLLGLLGMVLVLLDGMGLL